MEALVGHTLQDIGDQVLLRVDDEHAPSCFDVGLDEVGHGRGLTRPGGYEQHGVQQCVAWINAHGCCRSGAVGAGEDTASQQVGRGVQPRRWGDEAGRNGWQSRQVAVSDRPTQQAGDLAGGQAQWVAPRNPHTVEVEWVARREAQPYPRCLGNTKTAEKALYECFRPWGSA